MNQHNETSEEIMRHLDESFRDVRKLIIQEWNRHNVNSLGMTHAKLLLILKDNGPTNVSALADLLSITNGGVTGIADRLIELDYIHRERNSKDRRVVLLNLTDAGAGVVERIRTVQQNMMMKLFQGMSMEDMLHAKQLFNQMASNLKGNSE